MSQTIDDIARNTAKRLSSELKLPLYAAVEAELQAGQTPKRFEPVTIAISLAALLVSATKAAWDVYRDVKDDSKDKPAPAVVERKLRIELQIDGNVSAEQRDGIIAVAVDEVAKAISSS